MARVKKEPKIIGIIVACVLIFCAVMAGTILGVQFFTKTGLFKEPGRVVLDSSLKGEEVSLVSEIFSPEVVLDEDVFVSATNYLEKPELKDGEFLYEILVPVTDFYSLETEITVETAGELFDGENYDLISVDDLDFTRKLLKINGHYYLDDFVSGAIFRVIKFESEMYGEEVLPLIGDKFVRDFPGAENVLTLAQTGVTALSRGMNTKLYSVGDATYFSEYVAEYLSGFDLTHTSNESSFSRYANGSNICSDARFIDTLLDIGLDIVELTGNHNQDCGYDAARETIDIYQANGIKIVGGGKTASEAAAPLVIDLEGVKVSLFAYNLSTGGATHGDYPGANQYYEESAAAEIKAAKERGEIVIVDVQYYECNSYVATYEDATCDYANSAAGDQVGFFRHLVDLGADVVVGTSAHQPQTFELYGDGTIYYGLGNLFFDQVWWPGTTRSLVLEHYLHGDRILQTRIQPTVYGNDMKTKLMDAEGTKWFLGRLIDARP